MQICKFTCKMQLHWKKDQQFNAISWQNTTVLCSTSVYMHLWVLCFKQIKWPDEVRSENLMAEKWFLMNGRESREGGWCWTFAIHTEWPFYESGLIYIENSRVTLRLSTYSIPLEVWFQKPGTVLYIHCWQEGRQSTLHHSSRGCWVIKRMQVTPWNDLINDFC